MGNFAMPMYDEVEEERRRRAEMPNAPLVTTGEEMEAPPELPDGAPPPFQVQDNPTPVGSGDRDGELAAKPMPVEVPEEAPKQYDAGGDETPTADEQFQQNQATKAARPQASGGIGQGPQSKAYFEDLNALRQNADKPISKWRSIVGNILLPTRLGSVGEELLNPGARKIQSRLKASHAGAQEERAGQTAAATDAFHRASAENQYAARYLAMIRAQQESHKLQMRPRGSDAISYDSGTDTYKTEIKGTAPDRAMTNVELYMQAAGGDAVKAIQLMKSQPDMFTSSTRNVEQPSGAIVEQPFTSKRSQTPPTEQAPAPATTPTSTDTVTTPQVAPGQPGIQQKASRYNNPFNLMFAKQPGAKLADDGRSAQFTTPEEGMREGMAQIERDKGRNLTLASYINKFAPPSENDTDTYIANASKALGVPPETLLAQIDSKKLAAFQLQQESNSTMGTGAAAPAPTGKVVGGKRPPSQPARYQPGPGGSLSTDQVDRVEKLSNSLRLDKDFQVFETIRDSASTIREAMKVANGAGDIALLTAFAKLIDPLTGVRQEEFKNMAGAGGALNRLNVFTSGKWLQGEQLDPKTRQMFMAMTDTILANRRTNFDAIANRVRAKAKVYGVDPELVLGGLGASPAPQPTGAGGAVPKVGETFNGGKVTGVRRIK